MPCRKRRRVRHRIGASVNRHAIVTGASKGLGRAVVDRLASEGWRVSFGARSVHELEMLYHELAKMGAECAFHQLDVSDPSSVDTFFESAVDAFGAPSAVVHSAGVYGAFGDSQTVDFDAWSATISVNLVGTFLVSRRAISVMLGAGDGRIVVLSGGGATSPMPNISAYAASKAGVVRLVESLALEVEGAGISINAVAPGLMATDMLDQVLAAGRDVIGAAYFDRMQDAKNRGEDSMPDALDLISFLASTTMPGLTGRLISAKWDDWRKWNEGAPELDNRDVYTLRRILPDAELQR